MITGGEPMISQFIVNVEDICDDIRYETQSPIYLYTALVNDHWRILDLLKSRINGMTLTLHEQGDVKNFLHLQKWIYNIGPQRSMRLNIFKNVYVNFHDIAPYWNLRRYITWRSPCPLPEDEVFMRYHL
jgi:hypothetical protein